MGGEVAIEATHVYSSPQDFEQKPDYSVLLSDPDHRLQ
jgi:hypothetical protein